ncbi:MAG: alpha-amylase family glycosyl hydrolase [Candidatus Hadarchaeales archaeon]
MGRSLEKWLAIAVSLVCVAASISGSFYLMSKGKVTLSPPYVLTPDLLETENEQITLSWAIMERVKYRVQISQDQNFSAILMEFEDLETGNVSLHLPGPGTYYWRVRTEKGKDFSSWSDVRRIVVYEPVIPTLQSPENSAEIRSLTVTLGWSGPQNVSFRVQVATSILFQNPIVDNLVNTFSMQISLPSPGTYYWRVRIENAGRIGKWSSIWNFRVAVENIPPTLFLLLPENGSILTENTIFFTWVGENDASYLFQLSGLDDFSVLIENLLLAENSLILQLSPGVYFWRVARVVENVAREWSAIWTFTVLAENVQLQFGKHVIIITIDGCRPDILLEANTPYIDMLAENALYNWLGVTVYPSTTPVAHASLFTGAYPEDHCYETSGDTLEAETIFEVAESYGYRTALLDGKGGRIAGLERGVTWVKNDVDYRAIGDPYADIRVMENAIKIFIQHKPTLMFVLLPMVDSTGHSYGHESQQYRQAIERADAAIGILVENLKNLGLYENTILIIVSDHGMTGTNHGSIELGDMAIPIIVSGSGIEKRKVLGAEIVDIAPTVADLLRIRKPNKCRGISLFERRSDNIFDESDVIYQIMTDRFANGDPSNDNFGYGEYRPGNLFFYQGGDWQGIIDKLAYIKHLGVTAIWISSVHWNQWLDVPGNSAGYHGYWPYDFYKPEPHFGDLEKLKELVRKASDMGIAVVTEAIPNHTGDFLYDAPGTRRWRNRDETRSPELKPAPPFDNLQWYHNYGHIEDWDNPFQRIYHDLRGNIRQPNVWGGLDDLAQEIPEVKLELFKVYNYWKNEAGFAAFRFDASKHVPDNFRREFQENVGIPCFGESWYGDPSVLAQHWKDGPLWGFQDFPLMFAARDVFASEQSFDRISSILAQDINYPNPSRLVISFESHDIERFLYVAGGDNQRLKLALTFLLTCRGVPSLFYGTEQGLSGGADPNNRGMMPSFNMTPIYLHIKRLNEIRQRYPAISRGPQYELYKETSVYAYRRVYQNEQAIVILNNSWSNRTLSISVPLPPGTELVNLLNTDDKVTVGSDGKITVSLSAKEGKIYSNVVRENYSRGAPPPQPTYSTTTIRVHYDVGWGNSIYIRGDTPPLSWSVGLPATWTEGNIWVWETNQIPDGQRFEFKPLINDERWSIGANYVGYGGQTIDVSPTF